MKLQTCCVVLLVLMCSCSVKKTDSQVIEPVKTSQELYDHRLDIIPIESTEFRGIQKTAFSKDWGSFFIPELADIEKMPMLTQSEKKMQNIVKFDLNDDKKEELFVAGLYKKTNGEKGRFIALIQESENQRKVVLLKEIPEDTSWPGIRNFLTFIYSPIQKGMVISDAFEGEPFLRIVWDGKNFIFETIGSPE